MERDIITALRLLNVNSKCLLSDPYNHKGIFKVKTLTELCVKDFSEVLTSSIITLGDQLELFQKIPNTYVASMIINYLPFINSGSSLFTSYWILEQYFCEQHDSHDTFNQKQYMFNDNIDGIPSIIKMFNGLDKIKRYPFRLNLHLYVYLNQTERLAQLKNLYELSFYEQNQDILCRTIVGWLTYIKITPNTWKGVSRLSVPFLKDPKLLFKLLYYIPSLEIVTVGIEPSIIQGIPILRSCLVSHSLGQEYVSKRKFEDDYPVPIEIRDKNFPRKLINTDLDNRNVYYLTVPLNSLEKARQIEENIMKKAPKRKIQLNKSHINSKFLERFK
ncbi:similar to Zygosaccharomyces rouxii ZYRO0A00858p hypothetical protein [Maudiozyma saulgeensis]|uniref:Uncharacterized protein n=1 Tax=Maudiozyma saulgeensis TaxID=1789683 RepID=A0A1X7R987_9SACH|nr:similar to Zygosaccharomyces rouxii ZYRO0A00858p hypothetical protein [Kazachstania saulgeensis]